MHPDNTEADGTIDKCERMSVIDDDEVGNESCHSSNVTRIQPCINTPANVCLETTCDRLRKPRKAASEQENALTVTRKTDCFSHLGTEDNDIDSTGVDFQMTSQQVSVTRSSYKLPASEPIEKEFIIIDSELKNIKSEENFVPSHKEHHLEEIIYICDICRQKFNHKNLLVKHIMAHTEKTLLTCNLCQYKCKYNSHLVRHMRTHTGEKPFACKLCHYKCSKNYDLVMHMRTHTGEKPFACKLCHYKCSQNSNLVMHMRTHW